jgi:hypothetical protein
MQRACLHVWLAVAVTAFLPRHCPPHTPEAEVWPSTPHGHLNKRTPQAVPVQEPLLLWGNLPASLTASKHHQDTVVWAVHDQQAVPALSCGPAICLLCWRLSQAAPSSPGNGLGRPPRPPRYAQDGLACQCYSATPSKLDAVPGSPSDSGLDQQWV